MKTFIVRRTKTIISDLTELDVIYKKLKILLCSVFDLFCDFGHYNRFVNIKACLE